MIGVRWWLALLAVVVAAAFRLYRLDSVPPGLFFDEAQYGVDAAAIAAGERFPLMVEVGEVKGRTREPLFMYLAAGLFQVTGVSVTALRATAALIGIATVLLFYVLCDRLVAPPTAFIAALFLAACQWHVTFSRIGMRAILTPLWMVLTGLTVLHLFRARTAGAAALCGVTLGAGWYTYQGYWVAPLPILFLWAIAAWRRRGRGLRGELRLAAAGLGAFAVVTAPLIAYALTKPDFYFARAVEVAGSVAPVRGRLAVLIDNIQRVVFMPTLTNQTPAQFGVPGAPLLDPLIGVAFVIGLGVLVAGLRADPLRSAGILAFWFFALLPGAAGDMPGAVLRAQGAVPAVCLIAAVGLTAVGTLIAGTAAGERSSSTPAMARRWAARLVVGGALVAVLAVNWWAYFVVWAARPDVPAAYGADVRAFHDALADLSGEADVFLSPYLFEAPNLQFFNLERPAPLRALADAAAFAGGSGRDRVFASESPAVNAWIEGLYPEHEVVARFDVHGRHSGRVYRVRATALRAALSPAEQAEAAYWAERMRRDFRAMTERW